MASAPSATLGTLGILGGMSWESTLIYYKLINQQIRTIYPGTLHSCPIILHSFDLAPLAYLQAIENWDEAGKILGNAAKGLREAGADVVLLACNTMHICSRQIEDISGLKLLHIVDFTAAAIVRARKTKVALLGTRWTMEKEYFTERLIKNSLEVVLPDPKDLDTIHEIITGELNNGIVRTESKEVLVDIVNQMIQRGADCLVLGCTELVMLLNGDDFDIAVFDTTEIHAKGAAVWAASQGKAIDSSLHVG